MSKEFEERTLSTADLVAATERPAAQNDREHVDNRDAVMEDRVEDRAIDRPMMDRGREHEEPLAALFVPEVAEDFRSRWDAVQIGFVDDPREAVRKADELVAQVMKSLAESFAGQRAQFESQLQDQQADSSSTENMRVALRGYRSFFQRLLSL